MTPEEMRALSALFRQMRATLEGLVAELRRALPDEEVTDRLVDEGQAEAVSRVSQTSVATTGRPNEADVRRLVAEGFGEQEVRAWLSMGALTPSSLARVLGRALRASHADPAVREAPFPELAEDVVVRAARLERLEAHGETIVEELVAAPTARTFSRLVAGYRRRYVTPAMETWFAGVVERARNVRRVGLPAKLGCRFRSQPRRR